MALELASLKPQIAAAVNAIDSAYNTENLRRALDAYPQRIADQKKRVNAARKIRDEAEMERATAEAEIRLAILAETNDAGKAKWSNAEARDAELTRRKGTDPAYRDELDALYKADADLQEEQDAHTMLEQRFQSARIAGRLIAAELAAFSEIVDVGEISEVTAAGALAGEFGGEEAMGGFGIGKPTVISGNGSRESRKQQQKEAF